MIGLIVAYFILGILNAIGVMTYYYYFYNVIGTKKYTDSFVKQREIEDIKFTSRILGASGFLLGPLFTLGAAGWFLIEFAGRKLGYKLSEKKQAMEVLTGERTS